MWTDWYTVKMAQAKLPAGASKTFAGIVYLRFPQLISGILPAVLQDNGPGVARRSYYNIVQDVRKPYL